MEEPIFKFSETTNRMNMIHNMHEMKFTKFFDVKSPVSENVHDRYNNAGVDLFMPRVSKKFLSALLEANQPIYGHKLMLKIADTEYSNSNHLSNANLEDEDFNLLDFQILYQLEDSDAQRVYKTEKQLCLLSYRGDTQEFQFFERMQIPLGIAIEIPMGCYVDLRSKSSNFKNGYYEITGLIDSCYTYGMGVQLIPFHGNLISVNPKIKADEKITQIVLSQYVTIYNFVELSQEMWDNDTEIINRREKRTGGFGSTGRF